MAASTGPFSRRARRSEIHQLGEAHAEPLGKLGKDFEGGVSLAGFDLGDVVPAEPGASGKLVLREVRSQAELLDMGPKAGS